MPNYYVSGEYEPLPIAPISVPTGKLNIVNRLMEHRQEWATNRNSDSWDRGNATRLAMASINKLLDHYPHGTPRDFIAQYAEVDPIQPEVVEDERAAA